MSRIRLAGIAALGLVIAGATLSVALDVTTKKLSIKDNALNVTKRSLQLSSGDVGILFSAMGDPTTDGAAIHVYSATDNFCLILPEALGTFVNKNSVWKYTNKTTKTSLQAGNKKLKIKIKGTNVGYSLADDGTQGPVNAQVQIGAGVRYCMRCSAPKKNSATAYSASKCAIAGCDPEPPGCDSVTTTSTSTSSTTNTTEITTTTSSTSTTSSTICSQAGTVLKGSLTQTVGRFNYNLTLGLPGANAACNTNFPGTHACSYTELQNAQAAGDLAGLKDTACITVTSFWAIDNSAPPLTQCQDDVVSFKNWEYATAHTLSRGQRAPLNNIAGTLGALQTNLQCNFSGNSWVGCCQ